MASAPGHANESKQPLQVTTDFKSGTQVQGPLVIRDHDINEDVPDPSTILSQRLDNWYHCLNILYEYVDTYTTLTKKSIQSYEKIKKSIATLPKFTRYEGKLIEPASGEIFIPKGPGKGGSRNNTMGSSEIVLGALNSPVSRSSESFHTPTDVKPGSLPAYSDHLNQPNESAQQRAEQNEFAPHTYGIDGLFELLRVKNDMNLASLHNLDTQIKEQILPIFKDLMSEVKEHRKKFNHTIDKNTKGLQKTKKTKTKLISDLQHSIKLYNDSGVLRTLTSLLPNAVDYEKDPYLVKKYFFKTLNLVLNQENQLIDDVINLKEEIFALEVRIVSTIKKLILLFNNFQINHFEELINNLTVINQEFSLMDESFEIKKFLSRNLEDKQDDMLLLLSSKLPNDNELIKANLKREINHIEVSDKLLFDTINHVLTIPILKELITYQEIRKLSLKDKIKDNSKAEYFVLTKLKYLFIFGTKNEIETVANKNSSDRLLNAVDKDLLLGEMEPSSIFYLPKCKVVDDEQPVTNPTEISRSKSIKSKFGSLARRHTKDATYSIEFVGIDLNHKILNKISKSAHKRKIYMKFNSKDDFSIWNNLIREMSGDMEELAEDYDERVDLVRENSPIPGDAPVEDDGNIVSNHLNENFNKLQVGKRTSSDDDSGIDSVDDLKEAIKNDRREDAKLEDVPVLDIPKKQEPKPEVPVLTTPGKEQVNVEAAKTPATHLTSPVDDLT